MPGAFVIRLCGFELLIRRCGLVVTDEAVQVRTLSNREALVIPVVQIVAYRAHPDGRIDIAYLDSFEEPVEAHTFSASIEVANPEAALDELRFRYGSDPLEDLPEAQSQPTPQDE